MWNSPKTGSFCFHKGILRFQSTNLPNTHATLQFISLLIANHPNKGKQKVSIVMKIENTDTFFFFGMLLPLKLHFRHGKAKAQWCTDPQNHPSKVRIDEFQVHQGDEEFQGAVCSSHGEEGGKAAFAHRREGLQEESRW